MDNSKKEQDRLRMQQRRAAMTDSEKEAERVKNRERQRKKRAEYTDQQREEENNENKIRQRLARANYTSEEKEEKKKAKKMHQKKRNRQENKKRSQTHIHTTTITHNKFDVNIHEPIIISDMVETIQTVAKMQTSLKQTLLTQDERGYKPNSMLHQAMVCVVCDHSIIGTDRVMWITVSTLQYHANVLSASYCYSEGINPTLRAQYTLVEPELNNLLLSPRARKDEVQNCYMCCEMCHNALSDLKHRQTPPQFAISNGFAIGQLPADIATYTSPLMNNLLAPVRAFNYFLSFNGGREQKITGNFTFFAQDVSQNIGALEHIAQTMNNPSVFVILLGSFTPAQLGKIRTHGTYNVDTFKAIYRFLHENNPNYAQLPSVLDLPLPHIEEVHLHQEATVQHESIDSELEQEVCWRYFFPSSHDPQPRSGIFQNQFDFAKAIINGETPKLIFHPVDIVATAKLAQLCPLAFPFGTGDINSKRRPAVNEVECLQHYL